MLSSKWYTTCPQISCPPFTTRSTIPTLTIFSVLHYTLHILYPSLLVITSGPCFSTMLVCFPYMDSDGPCCDHIGSSIRNDYLNDLSTPFPSCSSRGTPLSAEGMAHDNPKKGGVVPWECTRLPHIPITIGRFRRTPSSAAHEANSLFVFVFVYLQTKHLPELSS